MPTSMPPEQLIHIAQQRTKAVNILTAVFLALAWLTVTMRFSVRGVMIKSIGWDDWTMLFTNVCRSFTPSRAHL